MKKQYNLRLIKDALVSVSYVAFGILTGCPSASNHRAVCSNYDRAGDVLATCQEEGGSRCILRGISSARQSRFFAIGPARRRPFSSRM